ncbi:MAG TPA: hypothetical protein QGF02_02960 [Candidatus Babeliales bacterium]|nr:hypothetical protein [Candidatus Babeliales bacterium]
MDQLLKELDLTVQTLPFTPWWQSAWVIGIVVCGLVLFSGAVFYFVRRRQVKAVSKEPVVVIQESLSILDTSVEDSATVDSISCVMYTDLTKQYLSLHFNHKVTGFSDEQVCSWLSERSDAKEILSTLKPMFDDLYAAKYAGTQVGGKKFKGHIGSLQRLIRNYESLKLQK